jgi:hypothetical protein
VLADRGIKIRTASPTEKELEEEIKYLEMNIVKKIEVTDKRIIKLEFILAQT